MTFEPFYPCNSNEPHCLVCCYYCEYLPQCFEQWDKEKKKQDFTCHKQHKEAWCSSVYVLVKKEKEKIC